MNKDTIIHGSMYSFDTDGLAMITKSENGLVLSYKQGLQTEINITRQDDRDRQYEEINKAWTKIKSE